MARQRVTKKFNLFNFVKKIRTKEIDLNQI